MQATEIKAAVLSKKPVPFQPIHTPGWDVTGVHARELRDKFYERYLEVSRESREADISEELYMAKVCCIGLCDSQGAPIFGDEDAAALAAGPIAPLKRAFRCIAKLNAFYEYDDRAIEGNSETTLTK